MAGTVNSAVTSAVNKDWLTVDTSAAQRGQGPAQYGYPGTEPAPTVPTADNPLPTDAPQLDYGTSGEQIDTEGQGAWPSLPANLPFGTRTPLQRQEGPAQGLYETTLPSEAGSYGYSGAWSNVDNHGTYDVVSQNTDTHGWRITVPNDRTSHRRTFGQANPENNPTWAPYGERPVRTRPARVSAPFTPNTTQFGVIGTSYGELPNWAMTGPQGNTAYETPGPPATSSVAQVQSVQTDPGARWA